MHAMKQKHKFSFPLSIALCILLAAVFCITLSYFLKNYRSEIYGQIIESNISSLKETTSALVSKTSDNFDYRQHEVRMLGAGISAGLKDQGFSSVSELTENDRDFIQEFQSASVFDYCVLLNESGKGIYAGDGGAHPINLSSSQAYVACLSSPTGEAISFISDPFNATGSDVVAFSCHAGSVILIGIYSQASFEELYDSTAFDNHASYLIVTKSGLILSSAHVRREVKDSLNLFTYFESDARNKSFFTPGKNGVSDYSDVIQDFELGHSDSVELYFQDSLYELVYAPIPHTDWRLISCVSYDYITSDAVEINQKTIQLTLFIISLLFVMFIIIFVMLVFVLRASASREAVRRDRIVTLMTRYVPNVIVIADIRSGKIEYASHNTDKVLGIKKPFENIVDESVFQHIHLRDKAAVLQLIDAVRTGRSVSESMTLNYRRPDTGADIVLRLDGYLIAEGDSSQHFISITLEDITASVSSRQRLEQALANEERANAAKSTFLASMSHDIRTPINAIIGLTTLALNRPNDSEKVYECLQKIANSSQLLLGLVNDVLDMSKIESGKMQLAEAEFELGECLESVITVTQSQARMRGQSFEVRTKNIVHELLCGDAVRLGQVLTNVLGNAVKFTPDEGSISLEIAEIPSPEPDFARLVFKVSDNGIGMSREYMENIFDMFSRELGPNGQAVQGTGLGMAITKRIVDIMGGAIEVESELGSGTTIQIELSIRLSDRREPMISGHSGLVVGEAGSGGEATEMLRELGLTVNSVADCAAAVSLAGAKSEAGSPFSLVFLPYSSLSGTDELARENMLRALSGVSCVLLGVTPDENEEIERLNLANFIHTINLPLFKMSLYRRVTALLSSAKGDSNGFIDALSGVNILLVEDNALNMEIALEMLTDMMGAKVDTARDGLEGSERFISSPSGAYDMILMDLQMPVLGGLDAARKIRASRHPEAACIPIIALTANAFEEDRRAALEAGMDGFVSKPIDLTTLAREAARVLRERRPRHLLLADDNDINRKIAIELIKANGVLVDAAENGRMAVDMYLDAPEGTYDAVLLDLRMPVMDGFETALTIRSSGRVDADKIMIFALTASREDEVREQTANVGFNAVMSKPINMNMLKGLMGI